ncbi:3-deoxy-manno-octulosonate cytidylyltransferase [Campylobacter jejuni]
MKILGVIPARYASTRFPGKPLADILGKPMIWWVYQQAKKAKKLTDLVVATDDERIAKICDKYNIPLIMTSSEHPNCFYRIHEVSNKMKFDSYLCIMGDEPLMETSAIEDMVEEAINIEPYHLIGYREFDKPTEVIDSGNIKITLKNNELIYLSRSPIPYPHKTLNFKYYKIVGLQIFTKEALDFFVNSPMGVLEQIEDIAELRWIENHQIVQCKQIITDSIAVDNLKDLERAINVLSKKLQTNQLNHIKDLL